MSFIIFVVNNNISLKSYMFKIELLLIVEIIMCLKQPFRKNIFIKNKYTFLKI